MRIHIFDMDGVVVDFALGFTMLGRQEFGNHVPIVRAHDYSCWGFGDYLTKEEQSTLWQIVIASDDFWLNLTPLVSYEVFKRINDLTWRGDHVYFVTSRPGKASMSAQRQTYLWLKDQGIIAPNVVVTGKKGEFAKMIGAHYSIEDKIENAWVIHWLSNKTKSYLIDRPYNRIPEEPKIGSSHIIRVPDIETFLDEVEK